MNDIVPATPHDLSFLGLFLQADPIVKGVMILLVLASLGCWTIVVEKLLRFRNVRRQARAFERSARSGRETSSAICRATQGGSLPPVTRRGATGPSESRAERRERIERAMRGCALRRHASAPVGLPFLATTGSAAPFIGLFGTVWGIMNSFSAIAASQDTSLCGRGARHRRGAVRHGHRPRRRHPGRDRLQQAHHRSRPPAAILRGRHRSASATVSRATASAGISRRGGRVMGMGPLPRGGRGRRRVRHCAAVRDQRHAARRRDAGAAHHLHGGGAADDRRRAGATCRRRQRAKVAQPKQPVVSASTQQGQPFLDKEPLTPDMMMPRSKSLRTRIRPGRACPRRQGGPLWAHRRDHGADQCCRISARCP